MLPVKKVSLKWRHPEMLSPIMITIILGYRDGDIWPVSQTDKENYNGVPYLCQ